MFPLFRKMEISDEQGPAFSCATVGVKIRCVPVKTLSFFCRVMVKFYYNIV